MTQPGLAQRLARAAPAALLTAEFLVFDLAYYVGKPAGMDARVYLAAARAWLSGGDPWSAGSDGFTFAGPPTALIPFVFFTWLPEDAFTVLALLASVAAAVFVVRRLQLPYWWLLFPPIVEAVASAGVNLIVLALLLSRAGWLGALTKAYAAVPLFILGKWRQLAPAVAVTIASLLVLPWDAFFRHDDVFTVLNAQANGGRSAWIDPPVLIPLAVVALAALGRQRAAWLAVPTLWPATQFHYSIFALPARLTMVGAAILAVPLPGAPVVAAAVEAFLQLARAHLASRVRGRTTSEPGSSSLEERDAIPTEVVG